MTARFFPTLTCKGKSITRPANWKTYDEVAYGIATTFHSAVALAATVIFRL